jgi:hypothetical protein
MIQIHHKQRTVGLAEDGDNVGALELSASDQGIRSGHILSMMLVVVDLNLEWKKNLFKFLVFLLHR